MPPVIDAEKENIPIAEPEAVVETNSHLNI